MGRLFVACFLLFSYFSYPCTRIVVPHITDAIQDWVTKVSGEPVENETKADVCIIEVSENERYISFISSSCNFLTVY